MRISTGIAAVAVLFMASWAAAAEDYAAAFVNSQRITKSQIEERRQQLAAQPSFRGTPGPSFAQTLDIEINRILLLQAAKKYISSDIQERVKARASEMVKERRDPKVFNATLESPKTDDLYNNDLLLQVYLQRRVYDRISISPAEMRDYYEANRAQFNESTVLITRQILVRSQGRAPEQTKALIDRAAARLQAGEDFAVVAKEMSQDPYASVGGLWPAQKRGNLISQVERMALTLKPGEVSAPFESPLGWHIVKLEESSAAGAKTFADVQGLIYDKLISEARNNAYTALIAELKSKAVIKVLPDGGAPAGQTPTVESTAK